MKTSACRDGTLKNQPNYIDGNDSTTLSHHSYILCHFAAAYTNMLCVFVSCVQRVVEDSVVSAWVMFWVAAIYNVLATEHGRYGLSCLYAETVESMSSAGSV